MKNGSCWQKIRLLFVFFAVCLSFCVAACGGNGCSCGGECINKSEITLKTYESEQLVTSLDECEWSSSDEHIAYVNKKGLVTAVGIGEAYIKVKSPKGEGKCKVIVKENELKPEIKLAIEDNFEIIEDDYYNLNPQLFLGDDVLKAEFLYSGVDLNILEITEYSVMVAKGFGTTKFQIVAKTEAFSIVKEIFVTVREDVEIVTPFESLVLVPELPSIYDKKVSSEDYLAEKMLDVSVKYKSVEVSDLSGKLEIISSDINVICIEDARKIKAVGLGQADVIVRFDSGKSIVEKRIPVSVERARIASNSGTIMLNREASKTTYDFNVSVSSIRNGLSYDDIKEVLYKNGEKIENAQYLQENDDIKISVPSTINDYFICMINTSTMSIEVEVDIFDLIIRTPNDFIAFLDKIIKGPGDNEEVVKLRFAEYTAVYFNQTVALANDIDLANFVLPELRYSVSENPDLHCTFAGEFNGMGHSIKNASVGANGVFGFAFMGTFKNTILRGITSQGALLANYLSDGIKTVDKELSKCKIENIIIEDCSYSSTNAYGLANLVDTVREGYNFAPTLNNVQKAQATKVEKMFTVEKGTLTTQINLKGTEIEGKSVKTVKEGANDIYVSFDDNVLLNVSTAGLVSGKNSIIVITEDGERYELDVYAYDLGISNSNEFVNFLNSIINGNSAVKVRYDYQAIYYNKTVVLLNDIDLTGIELPELAYVDGNLKTFAGTFDGLNHTIKNATVGVNGIFGFSFMGGFKNVTLENIVSEGALLTNYLSDGIKTISQDRELCVIENIVVDNCSYVSTKVYGLANIIDGLVDDVDFTPTIKNVSGPTLINLNKKFDINLFENIANLNIADTVLNDKKIESIKIGTIEILDSVTSDGLKIKTDKLSFGSNAVVAIAEGEKYVFTIEGKMQIKDAEGFVSFIQTLSVESSSTKIRYDYDALYYGKTITLENDIDLEGISLPVPGYPKSFAGVFDGKWHTIKNARVGANGLFGFAFMGTFKNAILENIISEEGALLTNYLSDGVKTISSNVTLCIIDNVIIKNCEYRAERANGLSNLIDGVVDGVDFTPIITNIKVINS